jgi:predicted metal-dependent phosphoesterase TrpH
VKFRWFRRQIARPSIYTPSIVKGYIVIDLHSHTNFSDGTDTPEQLIARAVGLRLEALAITDHDNFMGYDKAVDFAEAAGLELICGIELSTRVEGLEAFRGRSVHLLGYFLDESPSDEFRNWLVELQENRRARNRGLIARLQALGMDVTLDEVQAIGGYMTGRPHFATLLVRKGYVASIPDAFSLYLADSAQAHVQREEPNLSEGIQRIRQAGGFTSLAHPIRFGKNKFDDVENVVLRYREDGLDGIEVYHSDQDAEHTEAYLNLCRRHGFTPTGGSDFHGDNKPGIQLGSGKGRNLSIPKSVLEEMRAATKARKQASSV